MKLSLKQKAFADEYIRNGGNAEAAAVKAGYSEKYARGNAHKLVANSCISAYIADRQTEIESERIGTLKEIQEFRTRVLRGEEKDQFGLDASLADRQKAASDLEKALQCPRFGYCACYQY